MLQSEIRQAISNGEARLPGVKKSKRNGSAKNANKKNDEELLHCACHSWNVLNEKKYPLLMWIFHCPNGGKRSRSESGRFKEMGVKPGVPDFVLPFCSPNKDGDAKYLGLAVELKSESGRLTEDQRNWLVAACDRGWCVSVVRTMDQYMDVINEFMNGGGSPILYGKSEIFKGLEVNLKEMKCAPPGVLLAQPVLSAGAWGAYLCLAR